jgi:hypothetical protein
MKIYTHGLAVETESGGDAGLRLIATSELPVYAGFSMTLVDLERRSLNERIVRLGEVGRAHVAADYLEEKDLRYVLLACAYHLERVATYYRDVTQRFESLHPAGTAREGNTSDPRVYYEIDAFFGTARRWYEQLRRLLWKHYGMGTRPRSIDGVLKSSQIALPARYRSTLKASWREHGIRVGAYRDCLMHNDPLNDGNTTCWVERWGERWGMTVRLPSNPEAKSRACFDFASGPDALDYCHELLCHLTDLAEATVALPIILAHLDSPRL